MDLFMRCMVAITSAIVFVATGRLFESRFQSRTEKEALWSALGVQWLLSFLLWMWTAG